MREQYVHFGARYFDPLKFVWVQNLPHRNKPEGGLWASSTHANYGWYEWSHDNDDFGHCRFTNAFVFELKPETRILKLKTVEDVKNAAKIGHSTVSCGMICLDFEAISEQYDVIDFSVAQLYMTMWGWDCDSILVMNPNVIEDEIFNPITLKRAISSKQ